MDSGYLGPGENQAHALEDDYDVTRELSPEEVLGVMDELVCHEVCFSFWKCAQWGREKLFAEICCGDRLDGMAHGTSALSNAFHIALPRQVIMAGTENSSRGSI